MYYVYVITERQTEKRYVGYTGDLKRRIAEHNKHSGSKYTKEGNWCLVYYEAFLNKKDAVVREKKLKQDGRAKYHLFKRIEHSLAGQNRCGMKSPDRLSGR